MFQNLPQLVPLSWLNKHLIQLNFRLKQLKFVIFMNLFLNNIILFFQATACLTEFNG